MAEDCQVAPSFPTESIKVIAESIGISTVGDDVAKELSEEVTFRLKILIQDGMKNMHHGKRKRFSTADFDHVLKLKNIEPLYGIHPGEHIPFRFASGGGRELHFLEDKELEINEMVSSSTPRLPLQMTVKPHWLAIEGVQPTIPENPPPITKDAQKKDSVDPAAKLSAQQENKDQKHIHGRGMKSIETVKVKQLATHELSAEQQLYYKEITEACVGSDEPKRGEALHSLAFDPGLHQMVPRLCTFIAEGIRVNVVQKNLALLIYLMRMAKALLDNQTLYLEKYMHELVPSVMTCIVSRQLCMKPDMDNHWALRDFAARLISQICKNYNTTTNGLQTRITRVFSRCLNTERTPLSSVYGAVAGLSELGPEVTKVFVLPKLRALSDKIEQCMEGMNAYDKNAASHIKGLLLKTVAPVLKTLRNPPDTVADYKMEYGYLGPQLQTAVVKARQAPPPPTTTLTAPIRAITPTTTRIIQQGTVPGMGSVGPRTVVVNKPPTSGIGQQQPGQKVIIMTSRPPTPSQSATTEAMGGVMKTAVVNAGGTGLTTVTVNPSSLPAGSLSQNALTTSALTSQSSTQQTTKYVVVTGPNQGTIKTEIKQETDLNQPQQPMDLT
ncbi:transcription initiation factor TFIID subunit 6-like isoform X1 [Penaeus chinensis]|uniref:transcription initiation factor TFIID subunit 6-like isoform X1 n=2 Tax=Penaeus chinensis TaxID=139456 RepID=UPI001FB69EF2|nr:transcription initiation factor TFIID subunit 6-like isoform X1 [Penaeus chinensis]